MAHATLPPLHRRDLVRQVLVVLSGVTVYFGVRGLTESRPDVALQHAARVVDWEKSLSLSREGAVQALVLGHDGLVTAANWVYIWGHWPVIAAVLVWLLLRHPRDYRVLVLAMALSGAIGMVVFAAFPVAPPRLAGLGLVDTVSVNSHAYRVLQPPMFVNQYAAMPSLHVGWDLIVGLLVLRCAGHPLLRAFGVLMPVAMTVAVVVTANHYIVDALLGAGLSLACLFVASGWVASRQVEA